MLTKMSTKKSTKMLTKVSTKMPTKVSTKMLTKMSTKMLTKVSTKLSTRNKDVDKDGRKATFLLLPRNTNAMQCMDQERKLSSRYLINRHRKETISDMLENGHFWG